MTKAKKLTKAQREFFTPITREILTNTMVVGLGDLYEEVKEEVEATDVTELTEAVGSAFLARHTFAELKRVEAFSRSELVTSIQATGEAVGLAIQDMVTDLVADMLKARA